MKTLLLLLLLFPYAIWAAQDKLFKIPPLTVEALKSGEVRVYIPHKDGIRKFQFNCNIDVLIERYEQGTYYDETRTKTGDFWVLTFKMNPSKGGIINYWMSVVVGNAVYTIDDAWEIKELLDAYVPLRDPDCFTGATVLNGGRTSCVGKEIFYDDFHSGSLDTSKWMVHHKIPTYSEPNYEFNSYLNEAETLFVKNGRLYLKPIPFTSGMDVRGELNLTDRCTSSTITECYLKQQSAFILPPIKSAKITTKLSFMYGKIQIRAKLPSGDWIVPIIELEDGKQTFGKNSPKVCIAYSRGNRLLNGANQDLGSRMLYGGPIVYPIRTRFFSSKYRKRPFNDDFHIYTLEWRPGRMIFSVDQDVFGDIPTEKGFARFSPITRNVADETEAPYNREHVLSLGVAVGGTYDFPDGIKSGDDTKPWLNNERNYLWNFFEARNLWMRTWHGDDVALQVDYVNITAV